MYLNSRHFKRNSQEETFIELYALLNSTIRKGCNNVKSGYMYQYAHLEERLHSDLTKWILIFI